MWRRVLVLSMLLTLALGTVAEAKCRVCVDSVVTERADAGTLLKFTATSPDGVLPETGTAVVMQFDGQRSKCVNVSLRKIGQSGNVATYTGLTTFYGNSNISSITGRVDIGGDIHEFTATLDGKPGTLQLIVAADSASVPTVITPQPVVITPQPVVITPDPATVDPKTAAATAAAQRATAAAEAEAAAAATTTASGIAGLVTQPAAWLGLIVIVSALAGAYFDRKRALARVATG